VSDLKAPIAPTALNAAVQRASAILATDPEAAEKEARAILRVAPNDPRGLLILGSARRRRGDPSDALRTLAPLSQAYPRAAHTQYELGLTLAALGDAPGASAALRQAAALKPDLADAWRALGEVLFKTGDEAGAEDAFARHDRARLKNPALAPAADALLAGRLEEADTRLRAYLRAKPNDTEALRLMTDVLTRENRFADVEVLAAHGLSLDPSWDGLRFTYANALFRQQKGTEATGQAERLVAGDPDNAAYRNLLAGCLGLVGEHHRSIELYESLVVDYGAQPKIWLNLGHALGTVGRGKDAVAAYRHAIGLAPGLGEAYWSLANLKVAHLSREEETAMAVQLTRRDVSDEDRLHLHYALGKALEDRKDYAGAFENYAHGAALRRRGLAYDPDAVSAAMAASVGFYTADFFASRSGGGSASTEPIFIVGLPRSGSTLIEQILASHSAVEGTMELRDMDFVAARVRTQTSKPLPDAVGSLTPSQFQELGEAYLGATKIHRKLGRPFFIDKMPNNFQHIGLIQLILPNAKIIDARRHPLGACFSAFKQHFAQGQGFSYDLDELGRYYRDYVGLMAHFDSVLPGRIHRVIYEDMVEDTETEVRRLLNYCGLPFESDCLKFYETERAVRTVSSEQVRRPIFRDGMDHWRHFQPWLGPLEEALGPVLAQWRG
jgi:predicted Zn-dependent protease